MGEWEDLLDQIREEGLEDVAETLDKNYSKTGLRRRLSEQSNQNEEITRLQGEVALLKAGPARREALRAVGVDYDDLRPADREVVDAAAADTYDDGWARALVEKYQLPVTSPSGESTEGIPAAEFGKPEGPAGQTAAGGAASGVLTPATYAAWSVEKRMRFMDWASENRPDAISALDDGQAVAGITFS